VLLSSGISPGVRIIFLGIYYIGIFAQDFSPRPQCRCARMGNLLKSDFQGSNQLAMSVG
jgi:hypothetical protein